MRDVTSVLLLAGSTEATRLADVLVRVHGVDVLSSLAGVTTAPTGRAGRTRAGGFGGAEGLAQHLRDRPVDALIDATHPFAAVMPFSAAAAAAATATPSCRLLRPPWVPTPADRWVDVPDLAAAAAALSSLGARRVLLTVGRQSTWAFADHDAWFLVRAIEAPEVVPADHRLLLERGPFEVTSERAVLLEHRIDAVVSKNAGGTATMAKLVSARELEISVVMVARPAPPDVTIVSSVDHAVAWLDGAVGL
ncbi:MAG: cobalt-precorrin-6A reductase [Acidimicrobiia bacterium]|nr:cobalt-precorrin-6A reductase [Acidimicrobiia bacterium]